MPSAAWVGCFVGALVLLLAAPTLSISNYVTYGTLDLRRGAAVALHRS